MTPRPLTKIWRLCVLPAALLALMPTTRAEETPLLPEQVFPALQGILQQAIKQSPTMVSHNLDVLIAGGDRLQGRSGMLPKLGGYYQFQHSQDTRADAFGTLDTKRVGYNLSLTQPIFHWGALRNNALMWKIREDISKENYADAYRNLAQQVRNGYLGIIAAKVQLANAAFNAKNADRALASAKDRVAKKTMSEGEYFPISIANDRAHLDLQNATEQYLEAREDFATLTGAAQLDDKDVPDTIPILQSDAQVVPSMLAEFLSLAEPMTLQARILRQNVQVSDLDYAIQRKRLYPTIDFIVGISQDQQRYSALSQEYLLRSKYIGFQVNWNIFDGFATRGAIASSLARKRQAEVNYKQYVEQTAQKAQQAARRVDIARQQMALSDRLLDNSQVFLKFRQQDFQRGQASETDVDQARAGYNSSLVAAVNDRANFLNRIMDFVSLIGADPAVASLPAAP